MATCSFRKFLVATSVFCSLALLSAARGLGADPKPDPSGSGGASALVERALESELAGDNTHRDALLRQAVDEYPDDCFAHWQLGHVRVKDKWQSTVQVELAAQHDNHLAEYTKRRDAAGTSAADQVALALWCRRNRLDQQQRVHWLLVLQVQPDNADAIKALGLRPFWGMLATPGQIAQFRARLQRVSQAVDRWRPLIGQWLAAIEKTGAVIPEVIRRKLVKISDSYEMLGVERALWLQIGAKGKKWEMHRMTMAIALALAENPYPAAAESLARSAVSSEYGDVRSAAIDGLKKHPLDHSAPILLSGLQSPVEVHTAVERCGDVIFPRCRCCQAGTSAIGIETLTSRLSYSLYREGAVADLSFKCDLLVSTHMQRYSDPAREAFAYLCLIFIYCDDPDADLVTANRLAGALASSVASINQRIGQQNQRIDLALLRTYRTRRRRRSDGMVEVVVGGLQRISGRRWFQQWRRTGRRLRLQAGETSLRVPSRGAMPHTTRTHAIVLCPGHKSVDADRPQGNRNDQGRRPGSLAGRGIGRAGVQARVGGDGSRARTANESRFRRRVDRRHARPSLLGAWPGMANDQAIGCRRSRAHAGRRRNDREHRKVCSGPIGGRRGL